jgi:GAF domain-containing protein
VGYTALAGEPVISEDLATDERFDISAFVAEHTVTSAATVVIAGHEAPFGVLCAFSQERRVFSADDVNFLQAVANVISSAVVRVRSEERMLEVRDMERRRIARDLHDERSRT